ncbi:MAG: hypothetical protein K0S47_2069 [Herbinix sp.]|jgi:hypothetical protein|nr:hypothetical protein [Herbinix sp.]
MFDLDDTRYFEEYLFENNKISKLLLYLPVKPRINYYKISNMQSYKGHLLV